MNEKLVVSYWSGHLPQVAKLHFESFRAMRGSYSYILFFDSDIIPLPPQEEIYNVIGDDIDVRFFSLNELMLRHGVKVPAARMPPFSRGLAALDKIFVGAFHRLSHGRHSSRSGAMGPRAGWHPRFGYSQGHTLPYSLFKTNLPFRSDLFRCLVPQDFPSADILYTDLDICFIRPLEEILTGEAFTYRWGDEDFANSAFLYLPTNSGKAAPFLLRALRTGLSPIPWVMFDEKNCLEMDLEIYPVDLFDPGWSRESVSFGSSDLFFQNDLRSGELMNEVLEKNLVVHWHNHWAEAPEPGSTYDLLLQHFANNP